MNGGRRDASGRMMTTGGKGKIWTEMARRKSKGYELITKEHPENTVWRYM